MMKLMSVDEVDKLNWKNNEVDMYKKHEEVEKKRCSEE